jgi:hypothetical protein
VYIWLGKESSESFGKGLFSTLSSLSLKLAFVSKHMKMALIREEIFLCKKNILGVKI